MNFKQAIKQMREGKKVRKPYWDENSFWELSNDEYGRIVYSDNSPAKVHLKQLEDDDWEVFEYSSYILKRLGIDGHKWAKEFIKINKEKDIANDEGTMIGWFCNAIMAGFDENTRRTKKEFQNKISIGIVKQIAKELKRRLPEKFWKSPTIQYNLHDIINEIFGDKFNGME